MNGRREEKLAQLAFGDLAPNEAQLLERQMVNDSEALHTLETYKAMRDGLRGLADVPADQLSKERLRDAILTQGLRPAVTRQSSNRSWIWMPFAACLIGFGVMYGRNAMRVSTEIPQVVIHDGPILSPHLGPKISLSNIASVDKPTGFNAINMNLRAHDRKRLTSSRHRSRRHFVNGEEDPSIFVSMLDDESGGFEYDDRGPDAKQPSSPPPTSSAASAASGPIVMIDQAKDEQTGAQKATEVNSASNVLVGG